VEVNRRLANTTVRAVLVLGALACTTLAGCGQTGDLYLPEPAREIVTRPGTTPPSPPTPPSSDAPQAPNSPATADSPEAQPSPAPEVVVPKDQQPKKKPDTPR
jgi:predicted small lipoprotein YifL